jgi:hypothetical protein
MMRYSIRGISANVSILIGYMRGVRNQPEKSRLVEGWYMGIQGRDTAYFAYNYTHRQAMDIGVSSGCRAWWILGSVIWAGHFRRSVAVGEGNVRKSLVDLLINGGIYG